MIVQGLKLTLLGMLVVFSFLALLLIVIWVSARVLKPYTDKEASAVTSRRPQGPGKKNLPNDNQKLAAVIGAAIAAHRARLGRHGSP